MDTKSTGPGFDLPGELFLGSAIASGVVLGHERAIEIDNKVSPPDVRINRVPVPPIFAPVDFAEFFALGEVAPAPLPPGAPVTFPRAGDAAPGATVVQVSASEFRLGPAGLYEVSWQMRVADEAQVVLWATSRGIAGAAGEAPARLPRTARGGAAGQQLTGHTLVRSLADSATFALHNDGPRPFALCSGAAANMLIKRLA